VRAEDEKGKQELEESRVSYPKSEGTMEGWKVARARRSTCQGFYRYLHSHYIHMISKQSVFHFTVCLSGCPASCLSDFLCVALRNQSPLGFKHPIPISHLAHTLLHHTCTRGHAHTRRTHVWPHARHGWRHR
jgi:hypothetical protein